MSKNTFDFGFAIQKVREIKKMSLRELATLAKLSASTISAIENNKRSLTVKTLVKIAEALQIEPEDLIKIANEIIQDKVALDEKDAKLRARILPLLKRES